MPIKTKKIITEEFMEWAIINVYCRTHLKLDIYDNT